MWKLSSQPLFGGGGRGGEEDGEEPGNILEGGSDEFCSLSPMQRIYAFVAVLLAGLVCMFLDMSTGNWWVRLQNTDIGYWPASLFTSLPTGARAVTWGGEITNKMSNGLHTLTKMGNGHFPRDGYYTKSAFVSNIGHVEGSGPMGPTPSEKLVPYVSRPRCYDLVKGSLGLSNFGTHFYFGGYGQSPVCV